MPGAFSFGSPSGHCGRGAEAGILQDDELTGLQEDVRELRKISQPSGVMVGTVIPNEDADKAGLKARDIILKVDDKEFKLDD